jgi:Ran GTPase-activating protein (RanGAP) involved in mRNA processing and transport
VELTKGEQICGGFAATYKSLCNFFGTPVREDICWDVNNLYPSNNITEFNLLEFEQPVSAAELAALIGALQHNTWFSSLVAREMTLDKKTISDIAAMLRKNKTITEVVLSGTGIKGDGLTAISDALAANKENAVNTIDLSNNPFDEKGMQSFAAFVSGMTHGLVRLNLSNCGFNKAAIQAFGGALRKNIHSSSTLTILSLARNQLGPEGSSAVAQFLANPNALKELDISSTDANLDTVLPAVIRGSTSISSLNISGNKLAAKGVKSMTTFLQSSDALKNLNIASTSISVELLKEILRAIGSNVYLQDFDLNIADNKLGSGGASLIANLDTDARNIMVLNAGDNEFGDEGVSLVATGLASHQSLKVLDLSRNFSAKPTKARDTAVDNLINLISGECPLETLVLRGNKTAALRADLVPFLYGLATNDTLLRLDISGQQMGNKGALALGKALQINKKLQELRWDDNGTTLQGFVSFRNGLMRNISLKDMQVPVLDITTAKGEDPKKLATVFSEIQDMIARNCAPKSMLSKGAAAGMFGQLNILVCSILHCSADVGIVLVECWWCCCACVVCAYSRTIPCLLLCLCCMRLLSYYRLHC